MRDQMMNDDEVEAALSGGAIADSELAAVIASVRAAGNAPLQEQSAIDQIRMVSEAARLSNKTGAQAPTRLRSPSKRRWAVALTAGVVWRVAVASVALAASGAAAAAGALPDPVQSAVSSAASRFGIEIPDGVDQPNLGQSDQGRVSQPGTPDQDHIDDPGIDQTDQPEGNADWPPEQSNQPDADQSQNDEADQTGESDESEQGSGPETDEEADGSQGDEDQPGSENDQSDQLSEDEADQPDESSSNSG